MNIVITGATAGIGLSCVEQLCADGHRVIGLARGQDKLTALEQKHAGFTGLSCDLADEASLAGLQAALTKVLGGDALDVLINNAGYAVAGPVEQVPLADWKAQFDTNVFGTIGVTQAALPLLRQAERGRIINVSSMAGMIHVPYFAPYYASKHALEVISKSLRLELREQGIDVVVIRPGAVQTGFADQEDAMLEQFAAESELYREAIAKIIKWHEELVKDGVTADVIRDAIVTAVSAPKPKPDYLVPAMPAKLLVPLLRELPTATADRIVRRITGV